MGSDQKGERNAVKDSLPAGSIPPFSNASPRATFSRTPPEKVSTGPAPPALWEQLTWDQAPMRHWAGQGTRKQGRRASGRSPGQALAGMALWVPLERGNRHCTPRVCTPSFPQLRLQAPHSSVTHLEKDKAKDGEEEGLGDTSSQGHAHPLNDCRQELESGFEFQNAWEPRQPPAWVCSCQAVCPYGGHLVSPLFPHLKNGYNSS